MLCKIDFVGISNVMKLLLPVCLAAIAAIIVVGCSREHEEYLNGQGQADRDLAQGRLNVAFVDGTVALAENINTSAWADYTKLLRQRYGIGQTVFSLPAYPHAVEEWVRGYNEVATPRIEQEFGVGVLERTKADAQKLADAAKRVKEQRDAETRSRAAGHAAGSAPNGV